MAKIKLNGDSSGYIEISAPAVSYNNTLELGPGTRILTNLDNTFTGVSTFTSGLHVTGGNLAVGHNNPSVNLHVKGSASNGQIYLGGTGAHSQIYADNDGVLILNADQGNSAANSYLGFNVDNSERLRITSAGNVGIASVTPAARLDVYKDFGGIGAGTYAGRVYGTDSGVSETGVRFVTKGTGDLHNASDAYLMHGISNGITRFVFGANGNFGIGTDNPDATLKVNVASGNNGVVVQNTSTANIALFGARNGDATVQIGQWGSTASGSTFGLSNADLSFIYTTSYSTTHPSALALGTVSNKPIVFATNNTERLRVTSGGNIGINETSPYYKLHLKTNNNATSLSGGGSGNWGSDGIRIENTNTTVGSMSLAHFRNYDADWHIGGKYNSANNSDFIFSSEGNERLRITSDGKMGVGTASPNHRLTLHNSGTGTFDALNITSGLTNSVGLQFGIDSASNVFLWHTANGGIKFATNNVERARVTNNGITFNGDTAADNALNDYEQGTWNPTIAFGGSSTGVSYSERQGIYVKIGNLVWASIVISLTNNGSGTGDVSITLPFTVGSNSENRGIGTLAYFSGFGGLNSNPNIYASSGGATTCRLQHLNNGGGGNGTQVTTLTHGNIGNSAGIRGAIMYTTI